MPNAKPNGKKSFSSKASNAGEGMEVILRVGLGILFMVLFCPICYGLGSLISQWVGLIMGMIIAPLAFVIGFFWVEVKVGFYLLGKLILGIFEG